MPNLDPALLWQLADMPHMPLIDAHMLPATPGIYVVYRDEDVFYIGKSNNLQRRWANHHRQRELMKLGEGIELAYLSMSESEGPVIDSIEQRLTQAFQPQINGKQFRVHPITSQVAFGRKLHTHRKARGWSQKVTAKQLGISQQNYSQYENAVIGEVSLSKLRKLSTVLGIPLKTLIALLATKEEKETTHA